jgi:hypothetical protein
MCFQTTVNLSIKFHSSAVTCPVSSCDSCFSEETLQNNVTVTIYKKLSSFSTYSNSEKNEEVIRNKDSELEKLRKENEDLKKNNAQSNLSSSSSTPSKNVINNSKSFSHII